MDNLLLAADQKGRTAIWRALFARRALKAAETADRTRAREILSRFQLGQMRDEFRRCAQWRPEASSGVCSYRDAEAESRAAR